jgi:hypothetical protein
MGRAFRAGDQIIIPAGTPIVHWSGKTPPPATRTRRQYSVQLTNVTMNAWDGDRPRLWWHANGYLRAVELTAAIHEANQ